MEEGREYFSSFYDHDFCQSFSRIALTSTLESLYYSRYFVNILNLDLLGYFLLIMELFSSMMGICAAMRQFGHVCSDVKLDSFFFLK